jgi:hypothetical protein
VKKQRHLLALALVTILTMSCVTVAAGSGNRGQGDELATVAPTEVEETIAPVTEEPATEPRASTPTEEGRRRGEYGPIQGPPTQATLATVDGRIYDRWVWGFPGYYLLWEQEIRERLIELADSPTEEIRFEETNADWENTANDPSPAVHYMWVARETGRYRFAFTCEADYYDLDVEVLGGLTREDGILVPYRVCAGEINADVDLEAGDVVYLRAHVWGPATLGVDWRMLDM